MVTEKEAIYTRLFSTQDGQYVLKDLEKRFLEPSGIKSGDGINVGIQLGYERGSADVVRDIKRKIKE